MALIICKQKEVAAQRAIVDPRARMVPVAQKWQKVSKGVHGITKSKVPRNPKMCKDKWNGLHGDYKKVSDYHKGTGHCRDFWDLSVEEKDKLQLPKQFHNEFYDAIEEIQGEKGLHSDLVHVLDSQVEDSAPIPSENIPMNFDFAFNSQNVVNLTDTQADPTPLTDDQPAIGVPGPGNTLVKRKSAFMLVIEATDKSSKVLVEAMDKLNATQQDLEKSQVKLQRKSTKAHLGYMKVRDKKALKMNKNMVSVLSNLSTAIAMLSSKIQL